MRNTQTTHTPTSYDFGRIAAENGNIISKNAGSSKYCRAESRHFPLNTNDSRVDTARGEHIGSAPVERQRTMATTSGAPNKTMLQMIISSGLIQEQKRSNPVLMQPPSSEKEVSDVESRNPIDAALPRQYMSPLIQGEQDAHIVS